MQKETAIRKMEEYVQDFRAQLDKKDPASIAALTANLTTFFEDLEGSLPADANFGEKTSVVKTCAERFGKACENNNIQEAASALADMERTVAALRKQCGLAA